MKPPVLRAAQLAAPKQQRNWDWRAAANFILGGAGGGLLFATATVAGDGRAVLPAIVLGLALIGTGLTCVWFEIGRPLRALNVYRHIATSWMTREAIVALAVFACGGLALLAGGGLAVYFAGACGLAFLYSQARILAANKGIPAWRHPRSVPLMLGTGLTEGAGLLAIAAVASAASPVAPAVALAGLAVLRGLAWRHYRSGLRADGAPDGALRALDAIEVRFQVFGHVLPVLAALVALAWAPGRGVLVPVAGMLAVAAGWWMKYTLVRRAAFTQGLAMPHHPTRGRGNAGGGVKPGWNPATGAKAG